MTERSPDEELANARADEAARRWAEIFDDAGRTATAALAAKLAKKDLERAREAYRLFGTANGPEDVDGLAVAAYAARLGREGWEPGDPLVEEARAIVDEAFHGQRGAPALDVQNMQIALAGLKRGFALGEGRR